MYGKPKPQREETQEVARPETVSSLTDDEIVTHRTFPRRHLLTAAGTVLAAGSLLVVSGARALSQEQDDKAKPADPDKAKPADPDKAKPADPDKAKPADPDKAKPADPDKAKPADPDTAKPADPDTAKPADPDTAKP